jgi:hypothetical protein
MLNCAEQTGSGAVIVDGRSYVHNSSEAIKIKLLDSRARDLKSTLQQLQMTRGIMNN